MDTPVSGPVSAVKERTEPTPGPWSRVDPHDKHICVGPEGSLVVADVWGDEADYYDYTTPDMDTAEANARLIAAAPEQNKALKAAARELRHWLAWRNGEAMTPQCEKAENALRMADAAIQKATGADQ